MYGKVKRYKEALLDLAVVVKSSAKTLNPFLAQGTGSLSALGYYYRGIIYDSINQGEMGFNDMVMARSLGLADAYLYILNRFPQFRDPKMAAYQNLSYNIALMESKVNYKDGIDTCTRAIAQFPDSAMLYYTRAIYKRRLLKFTDAIADYQIAVKKDPHYSDAWMNMGLLQEHLGDTIAAMKNYQEAIQANPTNFRAYLNVGALLLDLHQYEQAIKYFKHGIACNLDETAGYQQLGDCYILLKQNEVGCEYYRIAEDRGVSSATMKRIHSCGISTSTIFK
jgi:tetratricopeptide (TPR) repeat protein